MFEASSLRVEPEARLMGFEPMSPAKRADAPLATVRDVTLASPLQNSTPPAATANVPPFAIVPVSFHVPVPCFSMLIGFSRVYLRVHYLTDVVVGMFLGIVCGVSSVLLFQNIVPSDIFFIMQN